MPVLEGQLTIPGIEPPVTPMVKPMNIHQQIADLQNRMLKLELEIILKKIQWDKEDNGD